MGRYVNNSEISRFNYLKVLLKADVAVLTKNTRALISSVVVPIYILIITNFKKASRVGKPSFIVVLAITVGLLATALTGYALIVARDRDRGVFQRLRVTPAPTWTIMLSRIIVQVAFDIIVTILVLVIGIRIHHIHISGVEFVSTLLIAMLGAMVFLSIAQALVGMLHSAVTVNAVGGFLYIALLLTGILGPSGTLGSTFQSVSEWTPVGTVVAVFQSALHEIPWSGHTWLCLLTCICYIVILGGIGIKWFKWDAR